MAFMDFFLGTSPRPDPSGSTFEDDVDGAVDSVGLGAVWDAVCGAEGQSHSGDEQDGPPRRSGAGRLRLRVPDAGSSGGTEAGDGAGAGATGAADARLSSSAGADEAAGAAAAAAAGSGAAGVDAAIHGGAPGAGSSAPDADVIEGVGVPRDRGGSSPVWSPRDGIELAPRSPPTRRPRGGSGAGGGARGDDGTTGVDAGAPEVHGEASGAGAGAGVTSAGPFDAADAFSGNFAVVRLDRLGDEGAWPIPVAVAPLDIEKRAAMIDASGLPIYRPERRLSCKKNCHRVCLSLAFATESDAFGAQNLAVRILRMRGDASDEPVPLTPTEREHTFALGTVTGEGGPPYRVHFKFVFEAEVLGAEPRATFGVPFQRLDGEVTEYFRFRIDATEVPYTPLKVQMLPPLTTTAAMNELPQRGVVVGTDNVYDVCRQQGRLFRLHVKATYPASSAAVVRDRVAARQLPFPIHHEARGNGARDKEPTWHPSAMWMHAPDALVHEVSIRRQSTADAETVTFVFDVVLKTTFTSECSSMQIAYTQGVVKHAKKPTPQGRIYRIPTRTVEGVCRPCLCFRLVTNATAVYLEVANVIKDDMLLGVALEVQAFLRTNFFRSQSSPKMRARADTDQVKVLARRHDELNKRTTIAVGIATKEAKVTNLEVNLSLSLVRKMTELLGVASVVGVAFGPRANSGFGLSYLDGLSGVRIVRENDEACTKDDGGLVEPFRRRRAQSVASSALGGSVTGSVEDASSVVGGDVAADASAAGVAPGSAGSTARGGAGGASLVWNGEGSEGSVGGLPSADGLAMPPIRRRNLGRQASDASMRSLDSHIEEQQAEERYGSEAAHFAFNPNLNPDKAARNATFNTARRRRRRRRGRTSELSSITTDSEVVRHRSGARRARANTSSTQGMSIGDVLSVDDIVASPAAEVGEAPDAAATITAATGGAGAGARRTRASEPDDKAQVLRGLADLGILYVQPDAEALRVAAKQ
uniref:Uncharacterized protein n=1 Tax=Bicosoecida sp. CB-2014 TaxID=1486930 RepID=A0A7S1CAD4_9STRA|mmetsp:Transcript_19386/g.68625  ORF Transcript_19386/g.68625 Transcript_19386/m.68625 type:complete len:983 (+) Transcript_19386:259-3207(+)